jgi:hypothetical protein
MIGTWRAEDWRMWRGEQADWWAEAGWRAWDWRSWLAGLGLAKLVDGGLGLAKLVDGAAGPPVDAVRAPGHELFVDQVPAQGAVVVEDRLEDLVDRGF